MCRGKLRIQRSIKQGNRKAAIGIEAAYRTALAKGEVGLDQPKRHHPTIGELLNKVETYYKSEGKLSSQNGSNLARVRQDFGSIRSDHLTSEFIERYIDKHLGAGLANATLNRRTELLLRAYKLSKIQPPEIRHLSEKDNVRRGFFTSTEFALVEKNLPADLKDFCRFAFFTGWRKKEIASLRWSDVEGETIYLRSVNSKNREARSVPISGELVPLMERRKQARGFQSENGPVLAAHVFHRGGEVVAEFRKSWATACKFAGVNRLFHDLRRSAVKNLIDSGVNQKTGMEISGHKTDAMFRRYLIVSAKDKSLAMEKVKQHNEEGRDVVSM